MVNPMLCEGFVKSVMIEVPQMPIIVGVHRALVLQLVDSHANNKSADCCCNVCFDFQGSDVLPISVSTRDYHAMIMASS